MKQNEEIPDEIVRFIQVVSDDENLKDWFLNLENIPNSVRSSELQKMGEKMKENITTPFTQMGRVMAFGTFIKFLCLITFYKGPFTLPTGDGGR